MEIFVKAWTEDAGLSFGGYKFIIDGQIVYETEVGKTTANVACFLGICHALYKYPNETIYSNNPVAIGWVLKKVVRSSSDCQIERTDKAIKFLKGLNNIKLELKSLK